MPLCPGSKRFAHPESKAQRCWIEAETTTKSLLSSAAGGGQTLQGRPVFRPHQGKAGSNKTMIHVAEFK